MATTRQRAIAQQVRAENLLKRLERPFAKRVHQETRRYYRQSIDDYKNNHGANQNRIFQQYKTATAKTIGTYARRVTKLFSTLELSRHKCSTLFLETKEVVDDDFFEQYYMNYMVEFGAANVAQITDTSRKQLNKALVGNESSDLDLEKRVKKLMGTTAFRAALIARTETHNAAGFAVQETIEDLSVNTGTVFKKAWVAAQDERTREWHAEMNPNEYIGTNELFDVGGEGLMYPGDPGGSPENICNCRCIAVYEESDFV